MRRWLAFFFCVAAEAVSMPALAQRAPSAQSASEPLTENQLKARQHFDRAKELYSAGSYREAIAELESARTLDPKAKDLVYNLGIVHEKLAMYDEAIADLKTYLEMDGLTAGERQKAEQSIRRIEGAKRETPTATPAAAPVTEPEKPAQPPPPRAEHAERGRVDALTIVAGSVAIVGLGIGTYFGIDALSSRPNDFVTGKDGSYSDLQNRADDAHTSAIVADVGLGVGIVAALATAWLYFGRTKEPRRSAIGTLHVGWFR